MTSHTPCSSCDAPEGERPLAVSVKTACKLVGVGRTSMWALIKSGRVQDSQYWSAAPRDLCLIGDLVLGLWGSVMNDARDRRHPVDRIQFFTIAEVAERLQVAPRTVRRWIKAGDLIVHRVGGVVRIAEGDLRAFLAPHREG